MFKTNIKTLKKVYNILEQLGLEKLLISDGSKIQIDLEKVIKSIFKTEMVNEFCQTVTGNLTKDYEECEIKEVGDIVKGFFSLIQNQLKELTDYQKVIA